MNERIVEIAKKEVTDFAGKKISRKEAIKKTGYIALSAATMMVLLNSPKAQAASPCEDRHHDIGRHQGGGSHGGGNGDSGHR